MVSFVKESNVGSSFLFGTEDGMFHRLWQERSVCHFYSVSNTFIYPNMKKTRLEDVLESLEKDKYEITLDKDRREKGKKTLDEMLKYL